MTDRNIDNNLSLEVLSALSKVVGKSASLHEPSFTGNENNYLQECIKSTYVSSNGFYLDKFSEMLSEFTGSEYVSLIVNGTSALHMALKIAGVERYDEVIIPSLTFVATANAVSYCGGIPHFVDVNEKDLGIDASKLRDYANKNFDLENGTCVNKLTRRTVKAIVPMHTFGHPSDLEEIAILSRELNLKLIEDAAESLGSFYKNKHTGTYGDMGILSFNGNKTITTGGGGAILTDNEELALKIRHLTTTAKLSHSWEYQHDQIGYNYRMPNLNAALGCAQLEQLPNFLESKRALFHIYEDVFKDIDGINLYHEPKESISNYWLQALVLDEEEKHQLNYILKITNDLGIQTRPAWNLLNEMDAYQDCPSMELSQSISLRERLLNIPSSPFLAIKNYEY
jgi:aminotransferase in exopolysaccharide biosynthesis